MECCRSDWHVGQSFVLSVLCCLAVCVASGCSRAPASVSRSFDQMGARVFVRVPTAEASTLRTAAYTTSNTMERLNRLLSIYESDSEIAAINRVGGVVRMPVSLDTYRLMERALEYSRLTDGAFDITVTPISYLWGFHGGRKPDEPLPRDLVKAALRGVGSDNVRLEGRTVELMSPFTRIDMGAIARGYAVDICIISLRRKGVKNVMVQLGQHMRCLGREASNHPWSVEIPNSFDPEQSLGTLDLEPGEAVATSLLRKDFVTIQGHRYGHIIDPRTGMPAEGTALALVAGPTTTKADALSTALLVLGTEKAGSVLKNFPRCEVLLVPDRRPVELWMTEGMAGRFIPLDQSLQVRTLERRRP